MLTAAQCRTVAFWSEGEIICPTCARQEYGELTVSRCDVGYDETVIAVSQYELDEYQSNHGVEVENPRVVYGAWGQPMDAWIYPAVDCDSCGEEIEPEYVP